MRTKRWIDGLNNSQKIRIICNGVGFYTTVRGAFDMAFTSQKNAVMLALISLGLDQSMKLSTSGIARTYTVYDENGKSVKVDVQVDLI